MNKNFLIVNIKQQLVKRMENSNLSTYSLEKNAGLKRGIIGNIVYDKSNFPRIDTLKAIADALDCSVDDLLSEVQEPATSLGENNLNYILMQEIVQEVTYCLNNKKVTIALKKFLFLVEQAYTYCVDKKNSTLDKSFIEWIIDTNQ